jgi:biotin carboxylase
MRSKTLLVLAAGSLQVPAITVGKRLGLRVVAADGVQTAPGLPLAHAAHIVDITNPRVCLEVARAEKVDGVIHICSEVAMASLGLVNRELGLHGPDPETVIRATNKERMRRAFETGGAPSPKSIGVSSEAEALDAAANIAGALIVKPSRNSGSRGVTYVPGKAGSRCLLAAFRHAMAESRDRSALIEQYVEGPEFSVEALAWNGRLEILAITDKLTTGQPNFVEMGHSQPTRLSPTDAEKIRQAAVLGIRALKLDWCAAHAEVKLATDGPYLMEIGARLGGDFITTELVPRSTGVDMVAAAIRLCLGEEPDLEPQHGARGAAIRYLAPEPGMVERVTGVEEARRQPGVQVVEVYVAPGDQVRKVNSSLSRVGHVIAEGLTAEEAVANAELARDGVRIETSRS